jgi:hypothetical protein
MRRFLASVSLLAVPAVALASYASPSELLLAAAFKDKPLDLAYEAHFHMDDVDAAAWLRGSTQGGVEDGDADINVTVDFAQADLGTMRAKAEARIVNKTLYVQLKSVEGGDDTIYSMMADQYAGSQWYMMPLEDVEEERGIDQEQATQIGMKIADAVLSMVRMPEKAGGSVYSLKLRRTAAADLKNVLEEVSAQYPKLGTASLSNKDVADLRRSLSKSNVHLKVMTDAQDVPTGMKFYGSYKDMGMEAVLTGMTTLRTQPVTVEVPAGALPMVDDTWGADMSGVSMPDSASSASGTSDAATTRRVTSRPLRKRH